MKNRRCMPNRKNFFESYARGGKPICNYLRWVQWKSGGKEVQSIGGRREKRQQQHLLKRR